jgi:hypothetical protein
MYRFFQRNQKKLLAVFGAFLMIVFILPTTFRNSSGRENPVVAYMGDEKIRAVEVAQARADWAAVRRINVPIGPFQQIPYARLKLGRLAVEIEKSPELFLLLQKEATRQGIRVSPDRVDNVVLNEFDTRGAANPDERERMRGAAEAFLLVETLYNRVLDNVKVSEPRVERELALSEQEVRLNLVEFSAADYEKATTAPTAQEVQDQFRRYANVLPGQPATAPSAGTLEFGYKYPNRVKLQYLTIGKDQVRQAIKKGKSDYDWEVAAQRYYQTHLGEFPSTQPASQPLLGLAAIPAPTTRPFAEVRERVMERVMQPEEARLMGDIRSAVLRQLGAAWEQQPHGPGGRPASGPATTATTGPSSQPSSQPSGNASFAFLERVAADVQKQFGVLPAVTSKADQWLTAEDLSKLPGIGSAARESDNVSFANYVVQSAEAFMPVPGKADASSVLSILEPSDPLADAAGNVYVFRLTDAQAAHAPSDLAEVKDKVEADVRAGRAYARAMDDAKKLLESAKKDRLPAAAAAAGRNVIPTGFFSKGRFGFGPTTIPNYPTDADAREKLVNEAYDKLLAQATPENPHPAALIELPSEKRALVAELGDVSSQMKPDDSFRNRLRIARGLAYRQGQELVEQWFRPQAVKARLGYRPADPEAEKKEQEKDREDSSNTEEAALD